VRGLRAEDGWRVITEPYELAASPAITRLARRFTMSADSVSLAWKRISSGWLRGRLRSSGLSGGAADAGSDDSIAVSTIGAKMLPTFRILLATASLAVLAVAVATHGLIPTPEVRTRIGEAPSISRSFIQEAMAPRLSIQALGDPAEERAAMPEATGMSSGQGTVQSPLGSDERGAPARMTIPSAAADDRTESSDPLGDLIRATMTQTPEPSPTVIVGPSSPRPPETAGLQSPIPGLGAAASPAATGAKPTAPPTLDATLPSPTKSEDAADEHAAPATSRAAAKTETKATAPPKPEDAAQADGKDAARPSKTPTLALDDEGNSRGKANATPRGEVPAVSSAAVRKKDARAADAMASFDKPRRGSARKAVERRAVERRKSRTTVERRTVRRKAVKRSRAASSRKSRKTAHRAKRHKTRKAASARRRGVNVIAPRRNRKAAAKTTRRSSVASPKVQYVPNGYPYQVVPNGYWLYYSTPATAAVVR